MEDAPSDLMFFPIIYREGVPCSQQHIFLRDGCVCSVLSHVQLFVIPWTVVRKTPSGFLFPILGDLPYWRIQPIFLASPELAGGFFTTAPPGKQRWLVVISDIHILRPMILRIWILILHIWILLLQWICFSTYYSAWHNKSLYI